MLRLEAVFILAEPAALDKLAAVCAEHFTSFNVATISLWLEDWADVPEYHKECAWCEAFGREEILALNLSE